MTTKKYLKTIEDIEALINTDTKIYVESHGGYFKFINGVLCSFTVNGELSMYSAGLSWVVQEYYIEVEEPVKDADENDIGKLCKFWSDDPNQYTIGILYQVEEEDGCPYCVDSCHGCWYEHCRPLTPAEVAEITGYKVED